MFENTHTPRERGDIIKIVRLMDFFNLAGKMFIRVPWKRPSEDNGSCTISLR
ncbi:MAG: hypothetical protein GXY14_04840 [Spirochaetes bacterium]|nr:hypothetical protein [Spirochaetota bacterium]